MFARLAEVRGVKKVVVFVAVCCIAVGVYFGYIRKPPAPGTGRRVEIIPGIEFVFTRDENAADYYAKACESMSRRATDDRKMESLTPQEREWFMLGTSCRRCSWYPEHYAHVTDQMARLPQMQYLRGMGRIMSLEGRSAEKRGNLKAAMDIWKRVAVLGWHTETEEECLIQVLVGVAIEQIAYDELIRHHRERSDVQQAQRYEAFKQRLRDRSKEFRALAPENLAGYQRTRTMAVSHGSALWRKEACGAVAFYCIVRDTSLRQDAAATLARVSREDRDRLVRETARNLIPYVLGQKQLAPAARDPSSAPGGVP
jgi:hypothetical protein